MLTGRLTFPVLPGLSPSLSCYSPGAQWNDGSITVKVLLIESFLRMSDLCSRLNLAGYLAEESD